MLLNMKKPLFLTTAIALSILIIGTGAVFATSTNPSYSETPISVVADSTDIADKVTAPRIIAPKLNEDFSNLTDEQKAEIYKITDEVQSSQSALLDKLVEFGVLDKDVAAEIKTRDADHYAQVKEEGLLPMRGLGGGGPKLGRGGRGRIGGLGGQGGRMQRNPDGTCPNIDSTATPPILATNFN